MYLFLRSKNTDILKKDVPEEKEDNVIKSMLHGIVRHEYKCIMILVMELQL